MKNIILCADDYGLNASVSQGIIDLLGRQHLSAVSCLSSSPLWPQFAILLKPFQGKADLGLHFNLTEGKPVSDLYIKTYGDKFFTLPQLIIRAFTGRLELEVLEQECEAQLKRFEAELGFLPDFMDGHQHIHQLPGVRDAFLRIYKKHLSVKGAYVRSVLNRTKAQGLGNKLKQLIIYLCGAPGFQRRLKKAAIPHNAIFSGIYSFDQAAQYSRIFPQFLQNIEDRGLIMCHPGLKNEAEGEADAIARARFQEYSYLSGEQFSKDCEAWGVRLVQGDFS